MEDGGKRRLIEIFCRKYAPRRRFSSPRQSQPHCQFSILVDSRFYQNFEAVALFFYYTR
jgi:hypothetical protein